MLHDIRSRLNALQLAHLDSQAKCYGRKCDFPDCTICLCGKRTDAKSCCDLHRSEKNNEKSAKRNKQTRKNSSINAANTLKIKDAWDRGFRVFKYEFLHHIAFDFSIEPVSVIVNGKKLGVFDNIVMWADAEGNYYLEKI
jgi:hypothetical protein